jgi:Tol biopolymer transport system component/DNA-binding winged helix-turn-helix (wHTH) protein
MPDPKISHSPESSSARIGFGKFELDREREILFRDGEEIKLQAQPMAILIALVARAGQDVSREELQKLVWPKDTHIEFEAGIATAIRKIRTALGDSADAPTYIRTLHRRGFRFIAPTHLVVRLTELSAPLELIPRPATAPEPKVEPVAAPVVTAPPEVKATARRRIRLAAAALLVLSAGAWLAYRLVSGSPAEPQSVAPLTSFPGDEYDASFSPDGALVAFSWPGPERKNSEIYIASADGGALRRITNTTDRNTGSAWSPDGKWIAFIRGLKDVWIVSPLGGQERRLAHTDGGFLTWTHDSREVVFGVATESKAPSLAAVSLETGAVRQFLGPEAGATPFMTFRISPDGKQLGFARPSYGDTRTPLPRLERDRTYDLYTRPVEGGPVRRVTQLNSQLRGWTWTPDSREMVFCSNNNGQYRLWRTQVDGSGEPRVVAGAGEDCGYPAMGIYRPPNSPDRTDARLVYEHRQFSINLHHLTPGEAAPPDGYPRVFGSTRVDYSPHFAPDGKRVAFISDRAGFEEIWVADSIDALPRQLTFDGPRHLFPLAPRWSPDGSSLVYVRRSDSAQDVCIVPSQGGTVRTVVHGTEDEDWPGWSHDGSQIYYAARRNGVYQIMRIRADGAGTPVQLTQSGGYESAESEDGRTLYFMKTVVDDSLWQMPTDGDKPEEAASRVVEHGITYGWWQPAAGGVYYFDSTSFRMGHGSPDAQKLVYFLSGAGAKPVRLGLVERSFFTWMDAFAVSPDGMSILYTQADLRNIDLAIVKHFR